MARTIGPMTALEAVPDAMRRFHVPGVAVGILRDPSADLDRAEITTFGVTSVENPLPVQPTTLFQIGSITKTITATVLMRLVEMGKLELEAPVRRYLPEFHLQDEDVAQRATVRHLQWQSIAERQAAFYRHVLSHRPEPAMTPDQQPAT